MSWTTAKTNLEALLKKDQTFAEIEVDGHKLRTKSVAELARLDDFVTYRKDEEVNGETVLKQAGFKTQAFNSGDGLK